MELSRVYFHNFKNNESRFSLHSRSYLSECGHSFCWIDSAPHVYCLPGTLRRKQTKCSKFRWFQHIWTSAPAKGMCLMCQERVKRQALWRCNGKQNSSTSSECRNFDDGKWNAFYANFRTFDGNRTKKVVTIYKLSFKRVTDKRSVSALIQFWCSKA